MKPEAIVQKHIIELMRDKMGFACWETSQGYRKERGGTRMTPGIPDLIFAGNGYTLFVEVKTPKGKVSEMQEVFHVNWTENGGISLVWRSDGDAWDWLVDVGLITEPEYV